MKITQVISTYNRGHLLKRSLERLCSLTLPDELIVVDDGGTDNTESVCKSFEDRLPIKYVYTHNPGPQICSHARNVGVRQASHDYIVTSEPELFWLTDVIGQYKACYGDHPSEVVTAGKIWFLPDGFNPFDNLTVEALAGDYKPATDWQEAIGWVAPYTGLWKKEWIEAVGGWDEQFPGHWGWDDIDLLTRLRINGVNQYINLDIHALHQFHGLGGDKNFINERYFRAKSFSQGDETNHADLVANEGFEWGKVKER